MIFNDCSFSNFVLHMCIKRGMKCQIFVLYSLIIYTRLKFINNSCSGNKGSHYSERGLHM